MHSMTAWDQLKQAGCRQGGGAWTLRIGISVGGAWLDWEELGGYIYSSPYNSQAVWEILASWVVVTCCSLIL